MSEGDERISSGDARLVLRCMPGGPFRVLGREGRDEDWPALAATVHARVAAAGGTFIAFGREQHAAWNAALLSAGFRIHRRKLLVSRDLTAELPEFEPFEWRTMVGCGERPIRDALQAASEGDPYEEEERDYQREWDELVEHTGAGLDPALWRLALVGGDVVGVVLPSRYPRKPEEGTLSYIGLLPASRGRGYGRRLHAAGLRLLQEAGVRTYFGSTDDRNGAMARIFEQNGCPVVTTQLFLRPAARTGEPGAGSAD